MVVGRLIEGVSKRKFRYAFDTLRVRQDITQLFLTGQLLGDTMNPPDAFLQAFKGSCVRDADEAFRPEPRSIGHYRLGVLQQPVGKLGGSS